MLKNSVLNLHQTQCYMLLSHVGCQQKLRAQGRASSGLCKIDLTAYQPQGACSIPQNAQQWSRTACLLVTRRGQWSQQWLSPAHTKGTLSPLMNACNLADGR